MPARQRSRPSRRHEGGRDDRKPFGPQPLKEGKTQLVAFNASAFPYRSVDPGSKQAVPRREERQASAAIPACAATVYWEEPTYSDRRSLLYLPPGFDPQRPVLIVLYFHGQGATLERDVIVRQAVPRQIAESGPEHRPGGAAARLDAADSSAGNFWKPGHFAAYVDEAAERLMRLYGDRAAGRQLQPRAGRGRGLQRRLPVGGLCARPRRRQPSRQGRDPDGCALWRRGQVRGLDGGAPAAGLPAQRLHRSTKDENAPCRACSTRSACPTPRPCRRRLNPGTVAFVPCGGLDMHGDFVTRAWRPDPLKAALAMIPGYALVRDKKSA